MTNTEYVKSLITTNDIIYIDTSSLMNVSSFEDFIEHYIDIFINQSKKITVTREVCLEIVKHLSSRCLEKQVKAKRVIEIFKKHQNIFIFEDENLNHLEADIAFADSELLSRITKGRPNFRQLLITNDKNLSVDAYNLNSLNSCNGQRIMVCYINESGKLNKGATENVVQMSNETHVDELYLDSQVDEITESGPREKAVTFKHCVYGFCLLLAGYGLGKFAK